MKEVAIDMPVYDLVRLEAFARNAGESLNEAALAIILAELEKDGAAYGEI